MRWRHGGREVEAHGGEGYGSRGRERPRPWRWRSRLRPASRGRLGLAHRPRGAQLRARGRAERDEGARGSVATRHETDGPVLGRALVYPPDRVRRIPVRGRWRDHGQQGHALCEADRHGRLVEHVRRVRATRRLGRAGIGSGSAGSGILLAEDPEVYPEANGDAHDERERDQRAFRGGFGHPFFPGKKEGFFFSFFWGSGLENRKERKGKKEENGGDATSALQADQPTR